MLHDMVLPGDLEPDYARLRGILTGYGPLVVAYSGGVDSGLLAWAAHRVLGERALSVLGVSPSLPEREREAAVRFLSTHGIPSLEVATDEMSSADYRKNSPDRCYFCKAELFFKLRTIARERGFRHIAYGANVDDQSDHRPGAVAAGEHHIVTPLVEAGLTKGKIRELARALGLSLWDKPAAPCLASRIPYFRQVTREKLGQVERAENVLKDLGFGVCRVRHYDVLARIEIPQDEHARIRDRGIWDRVTREFKRIGFEKVTLESDGFRSGRLNDRLTERMAPAGPESK